MMVKVVAVKFTQQDCRTAPKTYRDLAMPCPSAQYSVTPANENVVRKGSTGQYLLMWAEKKSSKSCSVTFYMISDVTFKHLLGVCEIRSENNCLTVYSLPLSKGRILPVV